MAILSSSHHESLKAQKAINELFVKYNIQFSGVSKSFFRISDKDNHTCGLGFSDLVSQIGSMSFDSTGLHWRPLFEEFEKSTSSDKDTCNFGFEYTLKKSPYKLSPGEKSAVLEDLQGNAKSSLEEALTRTFNG
ncbi:hypothetical protein HN51_050148 [Arachis hypogaea]|uniref:proteasome activator subunit 4-like isoform X1 n=1 Tax=Arachis ipaensis TaxID=130454 RepID=UPI0007AF66D5|nr:proteasome activator subunit 4-like isoform X1 [Arachis ipaensis]XP_016166741.1 proteasome activator subunit 4-like isoform X1 [Arachis ipaensis]XP_016166742.1 proteasome activator subunit 4-like isoform X1 [Arachis ipaensis]XP_020963022.1 proteasome activator subunit 4-like isoform X1 [Arachis ipaensis]XP_025665669.1 proteasome activator subunit 4 isoform X1 [Arachis hypogaea]XP_025665670.1 proteasome activator subunit 4 isoform X1 [Arachis hypogaea]XP_025665671.1 proteasome activator sub